MGGKVSFGKAGKSMNKRAGLTFPIGRIGRFVKKGRYSKRVSKNCPVFLTAIMEYLVAELIELGGNMAKAEKKRRIKPRHIMLAISDDQELQNMLGDITIKGAGVAGGIQNALLQKKETKADKKKKQKKADKQKAAVAAIQNAPVEEPPTETDTDQQTESEEEFGIPQSKFIEK